MFTMPGQPRIGHRVIELDEVDSTNRYAAGERVRLYLPHGTAVLAHAQTHGRGQRGRTWSTQRGLDLAVSFILLPRAFPAAHQFGLAKAAALAVHDVVVGAIERSGRTVPEVCIKWPNDVLVDGDKVAGILIANELQGALLSAAIVGIGLNVNSSGWPPDMRATSLLQKTGVRHEVREVFSELAARMEHWWGCLIAHADEVAQAYRARLWARDRFTAFRLDGAPVMLRPLDVDINGRLLAEDEAGRVGAFGLERLRFDRG